MPAITPAVQQAISGWQGIQQNEQDTKAKILSNIAATRNIEFQDMRLAALDRTLTTNTTGAGQLAPDASNAYGLLDESNPLVLASKQASQNLQQAQELARIGLYSPRFADSTTANKHVIDAGNEYRKTQNALNAESERRMTAVAQAGSQVGSQDDLNNWLGSIRSQFGPNAAFKVMQQLPPGPDGGPPQWNQATKDAIAPIVASHTKIADQMRAQTAEARRILDANIADGRHEDKVAAEEGRDRRSAATIAGAMQRAELNRGARTTQQDVNNVMKVQNDMSKLPELRLLDQYRKAGQIASGITQKLEEPDGYNSISTAEAQTFAQQYIAIAQNFRGNRGGKYALAQVKELNGRMQNIAKFFGTFGEGEKYQAASVMREAAAVVQDQVQRQNADTLQAEMAKIDSAHGLVGDSVRYLRPRASLLSAESNGLAKTVSDKKTGERYVSFIDPSTGKFSPALTYKMYAPTAPGTGEEEE